MAAFHSLLQELPKILKITITSVGNRLISNEGPISANNRVKVNYSFRINVCETSPAVNYEIFFQKFE